ncbi:MAG: FecR family protein [Flavobacteriaceae bacterium]|nr:FecR family protein [Flavobacteriaceae bacterium]
MKDNNMNNNYLAKWLNNEITDKEFKSLIGSAEFEAYNKIKINLEKFEAPKFDSEAMLKRIKSKTKSQETKIIRLVPSWVFSAAASVALLLVAYLFVFSDTTLSTSYGQHTAFNLEDGTYIRLNAKSTLSYNKRSWAKSRVINLIGEAYFEVTHGTTFIVKTNMGIVKVLGTHFNVKTNKNYLKVVCFEGKVEVVINGKRTILTKGNAFQFAKDTMSKWHILKNKPSWVNGINTYQNTPLFIIINDLESQFKIDIDASNIDKNLLLTASFDNNNIDIALKSIFVPLNFNYNIKKNKVLLSKK